jgi:hypothetical protein
VIGNTLACDSFVALCPSSYHGYKHVLGQVRALFHALSSHQFLGFFCGKTVEYLDGLSDERRDLKGRFEESQPNLRANGQLLGSGPSAELQAPRYATTSLT